MSQMKELLEHCLERISPDFDTQNQIAEALFTGDLPVIRQALSTVENTYQLAPWVQLLHLSHIDLASVFSDELCYLHHELVEEEAEKENYD